MHHLLNTGVFFQISSFRQSYNAYKLLFVILFFMKLLEINFGNPFSSFSISKLSPQTNFTNLL